jgi:hypothetical protein
MKIKSSLFSSLLATLIAFNAHASTCSVPSAGYPTIQSAIDDSSCAIINVAPGLYPENVVIPRSLVLNGSQAGQPVAGRISGSPAESTIAGANPAGSVPVITINATQVTIDGFTISNSVTTGAAIGIQLKPISTFATITNNIIDGITTADAAGIAEAIFIEGGAFSTFIRQNQLQNISGNQAARGIMLGDGNAADLLSPVDIEHNTITGVTSTSGGAYGVLLVNPLDNSGMAIHHNDFSNLEGSTLVHGLSFDAPSGGMSDPYNSFTNLIGPPTDNKAVWFSANDPDVYHTDLSDSIFNLTIASYGVAIDPSVNVGGNAVNTLCAWWGSPDGPGPVGPGHGARVSPNVVYNLWRFTPDGACLGTNVPTREDQCKNGGWTTAARSDSTPFKNQGDCLQFVNTAK